MLVAVIVSVRGGRRWEAEIDADFQTALKNLHVVSYELLVDRTVAPSVNTHAEVYRILRDQDDRYFLYMLLDNARGGDEATYKGASPFSCKNESLPLES